MTEAEALMEIAKAIEHLAREVSYVFMVLLLMLFFKKMGGG